MRSGEQQTDLAVGSTNREEKLTMSKQTTNVLRRAHGCQEEGGACSWATYKEIMEQQMPNKVKGVSTHNWLTELTKDHGHRRA